MPTPRKDEKENEFIKRAVGEIMREGLTREQALGKAYGMWRTYKNKGNKKMKMFIKKAREFAFMCTDTVDAGKKYHPVMKAGVMYSKKYSGVLDADPKKCKLNNEPGKLDVHLNFLESVVDNYKTGVYETIPYIDVNHERDYNCGNVTDMVIDNGVLMIAADWNEKGKTLIGTDGNGQYRYLSVDIGDYLNSETGEWSNNVFRGATLCNDPVYKNQSPLQCNEISDTVLPAGKNGTGQEKNKEVKTMKEMFDAIRQAMTDGDAEKLGKLIDELEKAMTDEETAEGDGNVEGKDKKADGKTDKTKEPVNSDTQMAEVTVKFNELSAKVEKLSTENYKLNLQLKEKDFDNQYVGKKIVPADRDKWFKLYMADQKAVEGILTSMKDLKLLNEYGTSQDVNMSMLKFSDRTSVDNAIFAAINKIAGEKNITFSDAEKIFATTADYSMLMSERSKY